MCGIPSSKRTRHVQRLGLFLCMQLDSVMWYGKIIYNLYVLVPWYPMLPRCTLTTRSEMFPDGVAYVTVGQAPDLATWNGIHSTRIAKKNMSLIGWHTLTYSLSLCIWYILNIYYYIYRAFVWYHLISFLDTWYDDMTHDHDPHM